MFTHDAQSFPPLPSSTHPSSTIFFVAQSCTAQRGVAVGVAVVAVVFAGGVLGSFSDVTLGFASGVGFAGPGDDSPLQADSAQTATIATKKQLERTMPRR